jgi:hypothetical protein
MFSEVAFNLSKLFVVDYRQLSVVRAEKSKNKGINCSLISKR